MDHLRKFEAGLLEAENADPHVSLAVGGLAVLEGPLPDRESQLSTLGQRVAACPRFAQRVRPRTLDLGAPEWVDDPDFDIAHHIRRIALPPPGDDRELFRLVADVMSWRLDRNRPLWEIWVIEGLADGRWAMLMKVHRCIADGDATAHMLAGLSDGGITAAFSVPGHGAPDPRPPRLDGCGEPGLLKWLGAARGATDLAVGLLRPKRPSTLNGSLTNRRRFGAARVAIDDVQRVCRAFGVTVNDVALTAVTESYRAMLIRHGEQPRPDSLPIMVPVSPRSPDGFGTRGNEVSAMLTHLPVDTVNPVERLHLVRSRLYGSTGAGQRQAGNALAAAAGRVPFALTAWALRLLTRLPQHGVVAVATSVPGPCQQLHIMGCTVLDVIPVPPLGLRLRTGVAVLNYADELFFGVLADFCAVPDVDEFARGIEIAVARLVASSRGRRATRGRGGLSLVVTA